MAGEAPRAPDGGVKGCRWWRVVHAPTAAPAPAESAAPAQGPVEKLGQAKSMLDAGLISESEYESIKAKIISSMT